MPNLIRQDTIDRLRRLSLALFDAVREVGILAPIGLAADLVAVLHPYNPKAPRGLTIDGMVLACIQQAAGRFLSVYPDMPKQARGLARRIQCLATNEDPDPNQPDLPLAAAAQQ